MRGIRLFFAVGVSSWILLMTACSREEVTPEVPRMTAEEQLLFFLEDSGLFTDTRTIGDITYYFRIQDTITGDTGTLDDGDVIYFHYSLAFLSAYIDTVTLEKVREEPIIFQPMDLALPPIPGRLGVNALWPVGLDQVLQATDLREGETYLYYLPPSLAYAGVLLNDLIRDKPVEIGIRIDSIKNTETIYDEARVALNQYIIDAQLRDTTVVPGGPVQILTGVTGEPVFFKRLGAATTGNSPVFGDSARVDFRYWFVDDSLNTGDLGALEVSSVSDYSLLIDDNSTLSGLQSGLQSMRSGERALILFGPELAYREAVCLVPDLRYGSTFYGDRQGSTSNKAKKYLLDQNIVPGYAFQTEPFRSYVFEVTLDRVY